MRAARYLCVSVSLFLPVAHPTIATAADPADDLDAVVVSATGTPQPRSLTGESVSVITSAELASAQTLIVSDALQSVPGAGVVRNGGIGQPTALALRGAAAGQSLVLVDGIRIDDPSAPEGAVVLSDVLVNNIARIEVLRGPQSTLYGSDAIGGVVNLITERGGPTAFSPTLSAEGGSLGTYRGNLATQGSTGALSYGSAVNYFRTGGISAADARDGNPERDPYRNWGATGNLRWQATESLSVDARVYYVDSQVSFDGYPPPDYRFADTLEYGRNSLLAAYAGLNAEWLDGRFHNRIAVLRTASDRRLFDPTLSVEETFYARGNAVRLEYQGAWDVTPLAQLSFGAETQRTTLATAAPSEFDPRPVPTTGDSRISGYYLQYQVTLVRRLTVTAGLRRDDNNGFGSHASGKFSAAWRFADDATVLHANLGDGFKAPSLYELYSPYSNPSHSLAPEAARGWEVGVDHGALGGRADLSATYFERRTRDQIDFFSCFAVSSAACAARPFGYYENIARSRSQGLELQGRLQVTGAFEVTGALTRMRAIDLLTGNDLARRPRTMASLRGSWTPAASWTLGVGATYTGARYDDTLESVRSPAYALVSLLASHALSGQLQLFGRFDNVLAKAYQPVAGYGAVPRTWAAGLRWTPR